MFMLLLLKDLLVKFIITCTLKNKLTTRLCLVEAYLASLHDLVSFKIEHSKSSRKRLVTKENAIDRASFQLVQFFPFIKDKAFAPKHMEVTHLGDSVVHQLIASFLLMDPEVNHGGHIARGIDPAQNLLGVLCSLSIIRAISQKVLFLLSTTPFWEAYTYSKTSVQDPSHGKRFQSMGF
jgi:hypothetical protein